MGKLNAAFWKWFDNSVVRNEDGSPTVLYHGTTKKFDVFQSTKYGHLGFHFGNYDQATKALKNKKADTGSKEGRILKVYLSIQHPLVSTDAGDWSNSYQTWITLNKALKGAFGEYDFALNSIPQEDRMERITLMLEGMGYDGIVYRNRIEGRGESWIAFRPNQIKSVDNDGTWDADDPSIGSNPPIQMKVEFGYAGVDEGFRITGPSGETAIGYAWNADFPNDVSSPSRGELFLVNVPTGERRRGVGKAISIHALELMTERGCKTANMSATSNGGLAIIKSLIREGYISEPLRTSSTGKTEHAILLRGVKGNPLLAQPTKHYGPAMSGVITHPGFHTGSTLSICQPYAQAKVDEFVPDSWGKELQTHVMRDYPVILELDMQGIPFTIDYDAAGWFNDAVKQAIEESEDYDALENYLDFSEPEEDRPENMIQALFYLSGAMPSRAVYSLRDWLQSQSDPYEAFAQIKAKGLPDELLAKVSGQFRYTQDVPSGRIVTVNYIRPVFNYLFPHYDDPNWHHDKIIDRIEGLGYDVVTLANVYEGSEVLTVAKSVNVGPRLFPVEDQRLEFHGTSWRNLMSAAPELKDILPLPPKPFWEYDPNEET